MEAFLFAFLLVSAGHPLDLPARPHRRAGRPPGRPGARLRPPRPRSGVLRLHRAAAPRPAAPPSPPPPPVVERPAPIDPVPTPVQPAAAPARRTSEDWEALIGGNWVNKIGVFVAVIGIALLLNYAWDQIGAAGRVALSLAASFAMLVSGVVFERREKYRTFSYGLIGGGWAALYTTVYAMYAVPAAKVLDNAFAATLCCSPSPPA